MTTKNRPVQRLASLKNPPPPRRSQQKSAARTCPNPSCPDPKLEDIDDKRVCTTCGTLVSDSNIVSEVTFGETSSGAAVVQGSYVGADQAHARSMGSAFNKAGGMGSREIQDANGKRLINQLAAAIGIPQYVAEQAFQVWKIAASINFVQGRRTTNVAAMCLYVACRKQDQNQYMLMDFAQVLQVNVFKLGQTYKAFITEVPMQRCPVLVPEHLIHKFATKLEFGDSTMRVSLDAARIMQRMSRDWMTDGRRPAGLCGACLILAARMNNFRRSVREVVYVVKVTDLTINQRLNEFKVTASSTLTVEQFRSIILKNQHDPPAFYKQKDGKKRKRGRQLGDPEPEVVPNDQSQLADAVDPSASRAASTAPTPSQVLRDADGYAIPEIPIDPALLSATADALSQLSSNEPQTSTRISTQSSSKPSSEASPPPSKKPRGRPRATSPRAQLPILTAADLAAEEALEREVYFVLSDPSTQEHAAAYAASIEHAAALVATQRGITDTEDIVPDTPDIGDEEFADDPEVSNCLLSSEEVEIKERIWVHENRDWLRAKQAKILKEQAEGPKKIVRRRKRRNRMGDMSGRTGGEGGEGGEGGTGVGGSGASTPAEAARLMMERRGFSKKINYKMLEGLFDRGGGKIESMSSGDGSRAESPSGEAMDGEETLGKVIAEAQGDDGHEGRGEEVNEAVDDAIKDVIGEMDGDEDDDDDDNNDNGGDDIVEEDFDDE
ncbi:MAG: transcription factor TFIIIB subunit brf1 [Pycnora praestabilis]|nr:MAG: transcription factor TFIIIB subunit brf1 [Pycnora praestabilis]